MCGRYTFTDDLDDYVDFFDVRAVRTESLGHNYNVAPTDPVYVIAEHDGVRQLGSMRWGLIPWFAKDKKGALNINARAETVATKSTFKNSFAKRRCLIPASGFYEWQKRDDGKLAHYLYRADGAPMAFAGVWSIWEDPETEELVRSCAIITTDANADVRDVHNRMPVVLEPGQWEQWLDRENREPDLLAPMLHSPRPGVVIMHPVSSLVNSVKNNVPELIDPLPAGP